MTVELATVITQGVFASRPAASAAILYYATDTKVTYYSNGSSWSAQPPAASGADLTAGTVTAGKLSATATDKVFGRSSSGAGAGEEIAFTAAARALADDADAAAQRTTLGIAAAITGTKLDDLTAPDDNTDLNATTSAHGLLPKLGGGSTNFLRADGTWAAPAGGGSITAAAADCSANASLSADTPADATGASISLAAGTWQIFGQLTIDTGAANYCLMYITDSSNAVVGQARNVRSTASPVTLMCMAKVSPGSTTTYKLRGQIGASGTILRYAEGTNIGTRIWALKTA